MVQVMELQEKTQTKNKNISKMIKKTSYEKWQLTQDLNQLRSKVKGKRSIIKKFHSFHIFQSNTHKSDLNSKLRVREKHLL